MTTTTPAIDTTALDGPELLAYCADDAMNWAQAFNRQAIKLGYSEMDEGWLVAWFANAIEHSWHIRRGGGPLCGDHVAYILGDRT